MKGGDSGMTAVGGEKLKWFEKNSFIKHMGFEVVKQTENDISIKLFIEPKHLNTQHNLHGGVHASMLDTVQTAALKSIYGAKVIAQNLNVHYVTGTSSGEIWAHAKVIQQGYKIAAVEAEIIDDQKRLIARGSGVYQIIR